MEHPLYASNIRNVRLDRRYFIRSLSRIPLLPLHYIISFASSRVSSSKCQLERPDNSIRGNNRQAFPFALHGSSCVYHEYHTAQKWIDRRVWNEVAEVVVRIKRQHSNFSSLSSELEEGRNFSKRNEIKKSVSIR